MKQLKHWVLLLAVMSTLAIAGCSQTEPGAPEETARTELAEVAVSPIAHNAENEAAILPLPELTAATLNGRPLKVVATTSIIGDVVAQVGGEAIDLTTLIKPGQDPHSYQPGAQELTAVAAADIIFVNGWDLEETLVRNLESIGQNVPVAPVAANITPLAFGSDEHDEDEHNRGNADPHTWFSIRNVEQWVENIETNLSQRDPANAETYAHNATAYQAELEELEAYTKAELGGIPSEKRFLVTSHDSFGYLAHEYDFEILGTIIPGMSTLAEPSAQDLANLIAAMEKHGVCTIFAETTVSDTLAQTVAAELQECETVNVVSLYTGSLGPVGSGTDSYIEMFRANVDAIVGGLD